MAAFLDQQFLTTSVTLQRGLAAGGGHERRDRDHVHRATAAQISADLGLDARGDYHDGDVLTWVMRPTTAETIASGSAGRAATDLPRTLFGRP